MASIRLGDIQISVPQKQSSSESDAAALATPIEPMEAQAPRGDGTIFVSIPSYRDGERCGQILKQVFEKAKNPHKIMVGVIEQNHPNDTFCIEAYCRFYGVQTIKRNTIRKDTVKIVRLDPSTCPHYDQIRLVSVHHYAAKGPIYARSFTRKLLANEEFCMQMDAQSHVTQHWDERVLTEWEATHNEFAIISHIPAPLTQLQIDPPPEEVLRQCKVLFQENGFPNFEPIESAGRASHLEHPLLAYTWSSAFSFAKCHLEEVAPYDPFSWFAVPIEQVSRFARFWTRGYDVYTPTRPIVYRDYVPSSGHLEWFARQRDRFRKEAVGRAKILLRIPTEGIGPGNGGGVGGVGRLTAAASAIKQANMGIYGLGKRRTLDQLLNFLGITTQPPSSNNGRATCGTVQYVPYDASITPTANWFNQPDNLEPQPEYPLRTKLIYYEQVDQLLWTPNAFSVELSDNETVLLRYGKNIRGNNAVVVSEDAGNITGAATGDVALSSTAHDVYPLPSLSIMLLLWVFGLVMWCAVFLNPLKVPAVKRSIKKKLKVANSKEV